MSTRFDRVATALATALAATALASTVAAEGFEVMLGDRRLGSIDYEGSDGAASLRAVLDDTPLGVSDGTFAASFRAATTEDGRAVRQYLVESAFTSGGRVVSVLFEDGRPVETVVRPESEATELSDPALAPAGALDPVTAFGRLLGGDGCPAAFVMYDGRRVVRVTPTGAAASTATLTCTARYQVVAGPAHLSPLGIGGFDLTLAYDLAGAAPTLSVMSVSAGPFEVSVRR